MAATVHVPQGKAAIVRPPKRPRVLSGRTIKTWCRIVMRPKPRRHVAHGREDIMGRGHTAHQSLGWTVLALALAAGTTNASCAQTRDLDRGLPPTRSEPRRDAAIGVASREADGSIVLTLRADGPGGVLGDAQFRYAPSDPNYGMIVRHVGSMPRRGAVPVMPFAVR
ncbi:hypothetical protein R1A27_32600 (plasmid) [Methylobacterium sp. NMS12]|uniref:hypothetical protein n=1 Tax=Methylobacterium sp. NMS12 TaxID=3079766 RepID=UPI003F8808A8